MKVKGFLLNWGIKFVGIVLLIFLLQQIDFNILFKTLQQFNWFDIMILVAISALVIITKAFRFQIFAQQFSVPIDLKKSTIIYGSSMFFSTITPGRLGDFIKVFYLKNLFGSSLRKGIYLSIVDRLFDLMTIFLVALLVLVLIFPSRSTFTVLLICLGLIILFSIFGKKYFVKLVSHFIARLGRRFKVNIENINLSRLFSRKLVLPALLSVIPNGLIFFQMVLINQILQTPIAPLTIVGILALGNLISMLPVTISGLGTRDATFVYLLAKQGIQATQAMTLSLAFFLFNNLGILLLGLLLFLIFKPKTEVARTV